MIPGGINRFPARFFHFPVESTDFPREIALLRFLFIGYGTDGVPRRPIVAAQRAHVAQA